MLKSPRIFIKNNKYWLDYYTNGKRFRTSTGIRVDNENWKLSKSASLLRSKIKQIDIERYSVELGLPYSSRSGNMSLEELLQIRIDTHAAERFQLQDSTTTQYKYAIDFLKGFLPHVTMKSLTREQIMKVRLDVKDTLSDITVKTYFGRLNTLFSFAVEEKFREDNPFDRFLIRAKTKPPRVITIEDEYKIFSTVYEINKRAFAQLFFERLTAFRVTEICNLKKSSIDKRTNLIYYKNSKGEDDLFPIYPLLERVLTYEEPEGEYLFHYRTRWPLARILRRISKKHIDVPYSTHQLKRAYTQEMNRVKLPDRFLFQLTHHSPVQKVTMDHYAGKDTTILSSILEQAFIHWGIFLDELEKKNF